MVDFGLLSGNEILSPSDARLIIKAIKDSMEQSKQWNSERNLRYQNGRYLDRWNYIFQNIENSFKGSHFKTYHVCRGKLWEFVVMYDINTNLIYLVLKENTFRQIKGRKDNPYHYIRIFNSKNFQLYKERPHQMNFLGLSDQVSDEYINEDLERMIGEVKDEVRGCVNILFKEDSNSVCKISANFANYKLDILKSYDLSRFITADIEKIIDTNSDNISIIPKIELKVRENKIKIKNEDILKKEKEKKNDKKEDNKS